MLYCPETGAWFKRGRVNPSHPSIRRADGVVERWVKNLKTKGADKGAWTKVRDGDGWASAPLKLGAADENLGDADVVFFAAVDGKPFECTAWVSSHLCTGAAARELELVDGAKPLFVVTADEGDGSLSAAMPSKLVDLLNRKAGGAVAPGKRAPKEKLSRAEKKEKKKGYGR